VIAAIVFTRDLPMGLRIKQQRFVLAMSCGFLEPHKLSEG